MEHRWLQSELDQIVAVLDQGSFFSITAEERQSLRGNAEKLQQRLDSIQHGFLTVGLLGGTGVGKSTLMNGLAGSEIASTSHRRPHTEDVLIYRHADSEPLPSPIAGPVPWREITHQADAIKQILLCDLPDFDSLMGEHRQRVLEFLEHLDVLVWVTSPEKYGDQRFYEFLQLVPKAQQNFYFVLNKLDLLFQGETQERGYEQMVRVTSGFQRHIKENGIDRPILYALSAQEALDSDGLAPWNQCAAFVQQIFRERDVKEITAIKAANLDVEVQELLAAFKKEVSNLEIFDRVLEGLAGDLEEHRQSWVEAGEQSIDLWFGNHFSPDILFHQNDPSGLVGPGYTLASFLQERQQKLMTHTGSGSDLSLFAMPEETGASFRRRLEWLQERFAHRTLVQNLPAAFAERFRENLEVENTYQDLKESFLQLVTVRLTEKSLPGFRGFRLRQFLTYSLLLIFFLLAIGGEAAWSNVFGSPGLTSVLTLVVRGIGTLFKSRGLTALASYALLNLLFTLRFYRRYRRLLREAGAKIMESLKVSLSKVWEEKLDSILEELSRFRLEIQSHIAAISNLNKAKKEP